MPAPKNGTAGLLVAPACPDVATDADDASPGEVEKTKAAQRETRTGKYGSQTITPYSPIANTTEEQERKTSWIEIQLLDANDIPVPGEKYQITLPDGTVKTGTLGADGSARVAPCDPGSCQVTFPEYDGRSWDKI
jgi:type VI secretion system secreted protein VgrG